MKRILKKIQLAYYKRRAPVHYARMIGVNVGENCRLIRVSYSSEPYLIKLGNHVSATATRFETHDGGVWVFRNSSPDIDVVKPIVVGDNVFIGYGAVIMPGVTVGSNVVIGAGSVVTRDIPDNVVAVGVPAKVLRRLDEYREKVHEIGKRTKRLPDDEKKSFYLELYKDRLK
ncbi:acyltransferase [Martelella endophytica]|uniref:acyltransferase n=1 Tax=Martelella endophytica TaxID=1486262 RepID=UPI001FCCD000|nr:acyltransferase [Martelella endophytica]